MYGSLTVALSTKWLIENVVTYYNNFAPTYWVSSQNEKGFIMPIMQAKCGLAGLTPIKNFLEYSLV